MSRKQHPSGRPIRKEERRDWKHGPYVENGFRNHRLNAARPEPVNTHAVGFIDWEIRQAQAEMENE